MRGLIDVSRVDCLNSQAIAREESAAYDFQSNGSTEIGIRLIRGLFGTTKLCLEARIAKLIPITHPLVPQIFQHVALLLNAVERGEDGRTPWDRARGRPCKQHILGIAESMLFKLPGKRSRRDPDGNMGRQWGDGVFFCYLRSSNTYAIAMTDGRVTCARSMTRTNNANNVPDRVSTSCGQAEPIWGRLNRSPCRNK